MSTLNPIPETPTVKPQIRISSFFARNFDVKGFPYKCAGMWCYGSFVYQNKLPEDLDVICVFVGQIDYKKQFEVPASTGLSYQVTLYSEKTFTEELNNHNISALECFYAPKEFQMVRTSLYLEKQFKNFEINKSKLRHSIARKCSNSFVKAKKKFLDGEIDISKKSLWHSMRMYNFGTQIVESNSLDFKDFNWAWEQICETYDEAKTWDEIHEEWKPVFNEMASEFREVAPK